MQAANTSFLVLYRNAYTSFSAIFITCFRIESSFNSCNSLRNITKTITVFADSIFVKSFPIVAYGEKKPVFLPGNIQ